METLSPDCTPVYDAALDCFQCPMKRGGSVLLDEEFLWMWDLGNWKTGRFGHVQIQLTLHRLVMRAEPGEIVDHQNRRRNDNRRSNLRLCTALQNTINRSSSTKHRFKGVNTQDGGKTWFFRVAMGDMHIRESGFPTDEAAALAYDEAAKKLHGEFAATNESLGLYKTVIEQSSGEILVNPQDAWMLNAASWKPHYAKKFIQATVALTRLIMRPERDDDVKQMNGNLLDCRRSNLRICTRSEAMAGRKKSAGTSSRFKGVTFEKAKHRWMAYIYIDGKMRKLGRFLKEEDAARRYDIEAKKLFGKFAKTNEALGLYPVNPDYKQSELFTLSAPS